MAAREALATAPTSLCRANLRLFSCPTPRRPSPRAAGGDRDSHVLPMKGGDAEELDDPLVLGPLAGPIRLALNDAGRAHGALLAPPATGLIGRSPRPRIAHELGIQWPQRPSEPHVHRARRR